MEIGIVDLKNPRLFQMNTDTRAGPLPRCRILITGASGELGGALARRYAASGMHLSLWGRDRDRLADVARTCRLSGANVAIRSLDLEDVAAAVAAANAEDIADPFDLVLLVAGLGDTRVAGTKSKPPNWSRGSPP